MTLWIPDLSRYRGPRYLAIVDALEDDVRTGVLAPGDRMPTHRVLAGELELSVGTVTRAYREAERRLLVEGIVGRGTFVRRRAEGATQWALQASLSDRAIDLSLLFAPPVVEDALGIRVREELESAMRDAPLTDSTGYQPHEGHARHRQAARSWLERSGLQVDPDEVFVCASAQHATMVAFSALVQQDDVVFTEAFTTPGIKDLAAWMRFRLHGLECDENGIIPEAFSSACERVPARVLHVMPTLQNPTTGTMSVDRRKEICEVAEHHDITLVEDGVHGLLAEGAPRPLVAFASASSVYYTSFSKTLAPGIRLGFLRVPHSLRDRVEEAMRASIWMASPLLAEVATRWIMNGTAEFILERRRFEAAERRSIALSRLDGYDLRIGGGGFHSWLRLPESWKASQFVEAARSRGVLVTPAELFATLQAPDVAAVRVCLGGPTSREHLAMGLGVLREILDEGPDGAQSNRSA